MRYCSEDAPRTGERNVNLNKTTSENAALIKMFHPDERAPSFIFNQISFLATEKHLSTNRNTHVYFVINKTFYKKTVLTNHTF